MGSTGETPNPRGSLGHHRPRQHPLFPPLPAFQEADYPTPPEGRQQPGLGVLRPALSCPPEPSLPSIRPSHAQPGVTAPDPVAHRGGDSAEGRGTAAAASPARLYLRGQRRERAERRPDPAPGGSQDDPAPGGSRDDPASLSRSRRLSSGGSRSPHGQAPPSLWRLLARPHPLRPPPPPPHGSPPTPPRCHGAAR